MIPKIKITVETTVNQSMEKVWIAWTTAAHITNWYFASADWHTPYAINNLTIGGDFLYRMEAKDGSFGFDFHGIFDAIADHKQIDYTMGDGRKSSITFTELENEVKVSQNFEAETENTVELQQNGWQEIMNNFKKYAESL